MIRTFNAALMVAGALALVSVYTLKFQAEGTVSEKIALERQIDRQEQELKLLRADWAVLNQPSQIEPIVRRHEDVLKLAIVGAGQFKSFDDLPMRPKTLDAQDLTSFLNSIEEGVDPIAALIEAN